LITAYQIILKIQPGTKKMTNLSELQKPNYFEKPRGGDFHLNENSCGWLNPAGAIKTSMDMIM